MKTQKPLKVLMTADCVGGVWTYCMELVRELGTHDVEVALAVMGAPLQPAQLEEAEALNNLRLYPSTYKLEWMEDPWTDVAAAGDWLLEIAGEFQPDIVHLNGYAHGNLPWNRPTVMVAHSCVCSWWKAVKGEETPESWNRYCKAVKQGLQAADMVIAPSASMLTETRRLHGPLENAGVIFNGRDASQFRKGTKKEMVLSAGRVWDEAKNIRALVSAAEKIAWPIYLAGETENPSGVGSAFRGAECHALGFLSPREMNEWFAEAAIYALPAKYEPFGLSILEAALSGCALVLGDIPSLREIWGNSAVYVSPDNPYQLAEAINYLIGNPVRLKQLASAAHTRAQRYSTSSMAAEYRKLYSELLNQPINQPREEEVLCGS